MDDFPLFYSGVKKVTHKLQKVKSIAITDDTFLKAFLSGSISCEDLQTKSKRFLMEGTETYNIIMDKIHGDYCAQTSEEQIRVGKSLLNKQLRCGNPSNAPLSRLKSSSTAAVPKI